jgi:hypothetical protein
MLVQAFQLTDRVTGQITSVQTRACDPAAAACTLGAKVVAGMKQVNAIVPTNVRTGEIR